MNHMWSIFRYNFIKQIRSKMYIVTTVLLCIGTIASLFGMKIFSDEGEKQHIGVVDESGLLVNFCNECNKLLEKSQLVPIEVKKEDDFENTVKEKEMPVLYLFFNDKEELSIKIYDDYIVDEQDVQTVVMFLQNIITQTKMEEHNISAAVLDDLTDIIDCELIQIQGEQMDNYIVTYLLFMLMGISIVMYSASVAGEVTYAKTAKVMEIIATSVSSSAILIGITLAVGLSGLLQLSLVIIFALSGLYFLDMTDLLIEQFGIDVSCLNAQSISIYLILFVLGFLFYSLISAGIGSLISKSEDITVSVIPVQLLGMVQFFVALYATTDGGNGLFKILSYVPFTSQTTMFVRYMMGFAGINEVIISTGILLVSVVAVAFLSSKLFKVGIMYYGDFNIKKIMKIKNN